MPKREKTYSATARRARQALRDETGAATIEAILWLPFFIGLFMLLVDLAMIFHYQSTMLRVVQDANRNLSIHRLNDEQETEDFITQRLSTITSDPQASTTVVAGLITTTASAPVTDLDVFGIAKVFQGTRITVRAEHLMEN